MMFFINFEMRWKCQGPGSRSNWKQRQTKIKKLGNLYKIEVIIKVETLKFSVNFEKVT